MASKPHAERLSALRAELAKRKLGGFIVPLTDEHQSEYVADYAQRLAWLTGFTGSAGTAVVLKEKAAVFVDGRYTLQAAEQINPNLFETVPVEKITPFEWAAKSMKEGEVLGYDPMLHPAARIEGARAAFEAAGIQLSPAASNPVDAVWSGRPGEPNTPVVAYDVRYAGKSSAEKRAGIVAALKEKGAAAAVITQLDSIAWLFNIRSGDVLHTPVSLAFAVVAADGKAVLYLDPSKVTSALKAHLGNEVAIEEKKMFLSGLKALGRGGKKVLADPHTASSAIFEALLSGGAKIVRGMDLCALPKAKKNEVELKGVRAAHLRDGAAVTNFLHWLSLHALNGGLDEKTAAAKLYEFRTATGKLLDLSFNTISAAGPHAAIPHYRLTDESNLPIAPGSIYLVDSGGQYLDGTTDITRTIAIGEVGDEPKERFTRVLKGHIAVATARFPKGTTGPMIDPFARRPLWEAGLDYDHGTGHGVGAYLAVHEGPGRISKAPNQVALEPGMIFSNEPGYYKAGAYGIRIENLVIVKEEPKAGEREMLGFETITFAPIDRNLVKADLLTEGELAWFNAYHREVREKIGPLVNAEVRPWLEQATAPLARAV
ncbi:MAG TPA: aminopeptidase P family protein [Sphingomonadales bacterium]|nr:aminopeptidase P family protein [Sphingomonadales bacterium]